MIRDQALKILDELENSPNMVKHAKACEAAMRALARKLISAGRLATKSQWRSSDISGPAKLAADITQNSELKTVEDDWGIVGLLHDADYEATDKLLEKHTDLVAEKLSGKTSQEIIDAIRGHCDKAPRESLMAKAIYAADELTGLIVATALVQPSKKLSDVTVDKVLKKFKEKSFAAAANRDQMKTAESELNIPLAEFVEIILNSMQEISGDLGL